ncbi:MAG: FCD domain-containing protein [Bacillota bacterium]
MSKWDLSAKEYEILNIINSLEGPVGSGIISQQISREYESFSEATIGRILRHLDERGFTEKKPYRGRILTSRGEQALQKYEQNRQMKETINQFLDLTKIEKRQELLDMLIARRAIEKEIARLAVGNIDNEDITELQEIIDRHHKYFESGVSRGEEDMKFHKKLAEIAGNSFLEAALKMIRNNEYYSPVLEQMRTIVGSTVVDDHARIVNALKTGDPNKVEEAMVVHIENIIADIKKYWGLKEK